METVETDNAPGAGVEPSRLAEVLRGLLTAASIPSAARLVRDVVIAEPDDPADLPAGALVLAVGARGALLAGIVEAACRAGAAAIAAKGALPAEVLLAASEAGLTVLTVADDARWDRVEAFARAAQDGSQSAPAGQGDLFSLAQTIATLTHGLVSIEDTANNVVAYSQTGEDADGVRRQSIMGRKCPEPYLAVLRELGVYQRVRSGETVVEVPPRASLGARRRMVIGILAGARPLGTIWVQESGAPLAERTPEILTGAARLAAVQLIDHYYRGDASARVASRGDLAHGLLTGRFNSAALAAQLGVGADAPVWVVAIDLRENAAGRDSSWVELRRSEAAEIISVHAAAYRRNALVAQACGQIYLMLPEGGSPGQASLENWTADLVTALRRHTGTPVQAAVAGVAGVAPTLPDIPAVKMLGWKTLKIMAADLSSQVTSASAVRAALVLGDMMDVLRDRPDVRDSGLTRLVAHDESHGTDLARSLLLYLDAFGDVGQVAAALHVHPNTLRNRVRRAAELASFDLDDPGQRLLAMIQLRLTLSAEDAAPLPFPVPAA